jgi:aspartyl-tRNA(Asn)/glutamyl-tRNA(Gln) amidotransferase subunit A
VVLDEIELAVLTNYGRSLETLTSRGVTVRRDRVEALDRVIDMTARFGTLVAADAYTEYRDHRRQRKGE